MNTTSELVARNMTGRRVLVIGDVVLDEYLFGIPMRLSREAPIPVLELERRECIPGGAANPARNLATLGARTVQVGVVGDDGHGLQLRALLGEVGIDTQGLLQLRGRVTATKTRVLAQEPLRFPQQVARIDHLDRAGLMAADEQRLLDVLTRTVPEVDAVLCSDYRLGLFTPTLARHLRELCQRHGVLQTVDAQGGAELFVGVDLFRCNALEAAALLGRALRDENDFAQALPDIQQRLQVRAVIVTRGPDGLALLGDDTPYSALPASNRSEVFDTTGAGDTFIAVATLALSAGADLLMAARLANSAAGLVVRRLGNAVVGLDEIVAAL